MKKFLQRALLTVSALIILAVGYLWLTFVSPLGYKPSGELPAIDDNASYSVFVYGTLKKPWVRALVMGRAGTGKPATLPGYQKDALDIKPTPGAVTEGLVITVTGTELRALDRYERLGVRYQRVQLTLANGQSAWVYQLMDPLVQELTNELTD
ncbi:Gamma-glutamyl cyclotransferase, AIG2-like [Arsukibacterium tuosuense]|uniref:Gamma-glutamyl cyclotransferase, AIG2-like n=1 Tax=Arsukibacterium tuosuense TaxID=1323745 RepID=A0A285J1D1_9GAMM|nr:gamma-glutamylcyclotransferase family protein [Arsukibacterium tuosuense]SNY53873.1 Gamma-glutamyl cyclotransferase, AIG2-like [Arsukibacterium tuosuense]